MPKTIISVDPKKAPWEQETPLHNRWHPDIPPVASVKEGESFRVSIQYHLIDEKSQMDN